MNPGNLEEFRARCRATLAEHAVPHHDRWEAAGIVDRAFWRAVGGAGLLGVGIPTEHGGGGEPGFRYPAVLSEELVGAGVTAPGIVAHNDVVASYLATRTSTEQKARWLPGACAGELVAAIALTEPSGGSDLAGIRTAAVRDGDHYRLDGAKTFVTNGEHADLILVAARTADEPGTRGISLFVVEGDTPGLHRGERLPTLGWRASDVAPLDFDGARVPASNLLGREGAAAAVLMGGLPRERLSIAVVALASAELALAGAVRYARERHAFGGPIGSLQANRFALASADTEVSIARVFVEHCIDLLDAGRLGVTDAAKAKWWTTELQVRVADRALQLHGGHGYLDGTPVAREWVNSRVQTIYGGSTEVMKELIGRSLGL